MTTTYDEIRTAEQVEHDAEVKARVEQGMALLQVKFGEDWVEHINCETLDLSDGAECVLGQLYDSYDEGTDVLGLDQWGAANHGFDVAPVPDGITHDDLQAAWEEVIC